MAHRGATYEDQRRFPEALADLERALALEPTYAWAIAHRGRTYEQMRHYEQALVDFDRTIALDASLIEDWHTERALLLSFLHRYDEALDFYDQGLRARPDDLLARYGIIVVTARQRGVGALLPQIRQLRGDLEAALGGPPRPRSVALYGLAGLAALEGRADEALAYLPEAIRLHRVRLETARHDLAWESLHDDARFRAILREGEPTAP